MALLNAYTTATAHSTPNFPFYTSGPLSLTQLLFYTKWVLYNWHSTGWSTATNSGWALVPSSSDWIRPFSSLTDPSDSLRHMQKDFFILCLSYVKNNTAQIVIYLPVDSLMWFPKHIYFNWSRPQITPKAGLEYTSNQNNKNWLKITAIVCSPLMLIIIKRSCYCIFKPSLHSKTARSKP